MNRSSLSAAQVPDIAYVFETIVDDGPPLAQWYPYSMQKTGSLRMNSCKNKHKHCCTWL
jgi:hypothetical protein